MQVTSRIVFPSGTGCVPTLCQVAVPAQHRVRPNQQPQPAQGMSGQTMEQGGEERTVLGIEVRSGCTELPFKDCELVPQSEDLHVLVSIAQRQQPQRGESVRDGQIGQA
ncbi:hypothetical protein ACFRU3_14500 [Streptomyces sp. NPDC056910]|uniref:hypothetical protein n=1 Tax=Streptomyces sp. NPDC056910 TaxID=3345964 RepID=UPI0036CA78E4